MAHDGKHRCRRWWRVRLSCPFDPMPGHVRDSEPQERDPTDPRRTLPPGVPVEQGVPEPVQAPAGGPAPIPPTPLPARKRGARERGSWPVLQPNPALSGLFEELAGGKTPTGGLRGAPAGGLLGSPGGLVGALSAEQGFDALPTGYVPPGSPTGPAGLSITHPVLANALSQAVQRVSGVDLGGLVPEGIAEGGPEFVAASEQGVAAEVARVARSWQLYAALGLMGATGIGAAWSLAQGSGSSGRGGGTSNTTRGGGLRFRWPNPVPAGAFLQNAEIWRDKLLGGSRSFGFHPGL